jgi:uncharacterized damage-inducible protein DinB
MALNDPKSDLHRYLKTARDTMLWKVEGLSEYDVRRPLTPTGTNLLGLVKHLATVELGYFGETFGRPFPESLPWFDHEEPNADMWATPGESREQIVGLYRRAGAFADETIESRSLESTGSVPWWPEDAREVTLHRVLVHVIAETNRHAGHADIVRELIDGAAGLRRERSNLADGDDAWWQEYRERVEGAARQASDASRVPRAQGSTEAI